MDLNLFLSFLKTIFVLVAVIALANISLRLLNKNMSRSNKLMEIIEKIGIGNNSSLMIVKICDDYYLFSSTNSENKMIKTLDSHEVEKLLEEKKDDNSEEFLYFWKRGNKVD